jgi:hypothetical protein
MDNDTSLETHTSLQRFKGHLYWNTLYILLNNKMQLTTTTLAKILAVSLSANDKENSVKLLSLDAYKFLEVYKACQILDSRRLIKQSEKKLSVWEAQTVKGKKMNRLKSKINNLREMNEGQNLSLTCSKINLIKEFWVRRVPKDKLEFYALSYDLGYWKQFIDILHTKPTDFQLEWFQSYAFGTPAPSDSIVSVCKNLTTETALDIIKKYMPDYNYLRRLNISLNNETKNFIASYIPINTLIWWLDELLTDEVSQLVINKLKSTEDIDLPYGVIVDKLFLLKSRPALFAEFTKLADRKLKKYSITVEQPVAVLGDASGSMEIAIKTSSIIMSILCALCNAEMRLFRGTDEKIDKPPRNVSDVIMFNNICKAHSSTAPAASLYPYLRDKKVIKTFLIVTDEEENTKCNDMMFAKMFEEYIMTVYPAKLVFVSFLANETSGIMYNGIKAIMPAYMENVTRIIFNRQKPDLTKLDDLLAKISHVKLENIVECVNSNSDVIKVCL